MAVSDELKDLIKLIGGVEQDIDDLGQRFLGQEHVLETWVKSLQLSGKTIVDLRKQLSAGGKNTREFTTDIRTLAIEVEKYKNIQKKQTAIGIKNKDELKKQNEVIKKIKSDLIAKALASKKTYESERKIQKEIDACTKSYSEYIDSVQDAKRGLANFIAPASKLIGVFSTTSMSVGSMKNSLLKYNQSMVLLQRTQQMSSKSASNMNSVFFDVSKNTVMSQQQFLDFAGAMSTAYLGAKPLSSEMASFAKDLQSKFGPNVELVTSKMQTLMGVQNKFPQVYDDVRAAQDMLNKGDIASAQILQNSILARARATGMSREEIATLIQATTNLTDEQKELLKVNEEAAKAAQKQEDVVLKAGQAAKDYFIMAAKAAQFLSDIMGEMTPIVVATGAAFAALSIVPSMLAGVKAAGLLGQTILGVSAKQIASSEIVISAKTAETAAITALEEAELAASVAFTEAETAAKVAADKIATASRVEASNLGAMAFATAKDAEIAAVAQFDMAEAASLAKTKAVEAAKAEAATASTAVLKAQKVAAVEAALATAAAALPLIVIAGVIAGVAYEYKELTKASDEQTKAEQDAYEMMDKLTKKNEKNLEIAKNSKNGKAFEQEWKAKQKSLAATTKSMDPLKRQCIIQRELTTLARKHEIGLDKEGNLYDKNNLSLHALGEEYDKITKNYEGELALLNQMSGEMSKQISLSSSLGSVSSKVLETNLKTQEKALEVSQDYVKNVSTNVNSAMKKIGEVAAKSGIKIPVELDLGDGSGEAKSLAALEQIQKLKEKLSKDKASIPDDSVENGQKIKNIEGIIVALQSEELKISKSLSTVDQNIANIIEARKNVTQKELEVNLQFESVYESRINTQRELYESAQFGMTTSLTMMQKQVDIQYKNIQQIEKAKDKLDEEHKVMLKKAGLSEKELDTLKDKDQYEADAIAKQMLAQKGIQEGTAEYKTLYSGLITYASQYNKLTDDQMQKQKKIYDLTKNVREGYLSAIRAMSVGTGKFSKTIATQEKGTSELMKRVKDVTGEWKLNTMALGQMSLVDSKSYQASKKTSGEYGVGGLSTSKSEDEQKAQNENLFRYKIDQEKFAREGKGQGTTPTVGTGTAAGVSEDMNKNMIANRQAVEQGNANQQAQGQQTINVLQNINESIKNGRAGESENPNVVKETGPRAAGGGASVINANNQPNPTTPVPLPPSNTTAAIPAAPAIPSNVINNGAVNVRVVGGVGVGGNAAPTTGVPAPAPTGAPTAGAKPTPAPAAGATTAAPAPAAGATTAAPAPAAGATTAVAPVRQFQYSNVGGLTWEEEDRIKKIKKQRLENDEAKAKATAKPTPAPAAAPAATTTPATTTPAAKDVIDQDYIDKANKEADEKREARKKQAESNIPKQVAKPQKKKGRIIDEKGEVNVKSWGKIEDYTKGKGYIDTDTSGDNEAMMKAYKASQAEKEKAKITPPPAEPIKNPYNKEERNKREKEMSDRMKQKKETTAPGGKTASDLISDRRNREKEMSENMKKKNAKVTPAESDVSTEVPAPNKYAEKAKEESGDDASLYKVTGNKKTEVKKTSDVKEKEKAKAKETGTPPAKPVNFAKIQAEKGKTGGMSGNDEETEKKLQDFNENASKIDEKIKAKTKEYNDFMTKGDKEGAKKTEDEVKKLVKEKENISVSGSSSSSPAAPAPTVPTAPSAAPVVAPNASPAAVPTVAPESAPAGISTDSEKSGKGTQKIVIDINLQKGLSADVKDAKDFMVTIKNAV